MKIFVKFLPMTGVLLLLIACGAALEMIPTASVLVSRYVSLQQLKNDGISEQDIADLQTGHLSAIHERYEAKKYHAVSLGQLRLMCEIYLRFNEVTRAQDCLKAMQKRVSNPSSKDKKQLLDSDSEAIIGKLALLLLKSNQFKEALELSSQLKSKGGQYIFAIAAANSLKQDQANKIAEHFSRYPDPQHAFWAANLFVATESYDRALAVLTDPEKRLSKDYGVRSFKGVFGGKIEPAVFHVDVFNEYSFGIFDQFSYAPKSNVYVEYLLAKSLYHTGELDRAIKSYSAVLDYPEIEAFRDIHWMSLYDRGVIAEKQNQPVQAIRYYRQSIDVIEQIRGTISAELGRLGFVIDKQKVYGRLIELLLETGESRDAFVYSERSRSRALVDLLGLRAEALPTEKHTQPHQDILMNFIKKEGDASYMQSAKASTEFKTRMANFRSARSTLITDAPELASLVTVNPLNFQQLRALLAKNETLISYYQYEEKFFVTILSHQDFVALRLPADDIVSLVLKFRQALKRDIRNVVERGMLFETVKSYEKPSKLLYKRLIEPIKDYLKTETITIVPTHSLYYLSFAALHTGKNFLVEDKNIRILPSLSLVDVLRAPKHNKNTLIFGNPLRNDQACAPSCSLPAAEQEAKSIAKIRSQAVVLLNAEATETRFRDLAANYGVIHIASHANFNEHQPLASRLLLTASDTDDGDVTVSDLYAIQLNADLVVLSACETAVSEISEGDEIIGLNRGFLFAGTSGIIGSLWQVEDGSTSLLMQKLYEEMNNGKNTIESLREAQRLIIKKYKHPYLWAAFQYIGI